MGKAHPLQELRHVLDGPVPGTGLALRAVGHHDAAELAALLPGPGEKAKAKGALSPLAMAHGMVRKGGTYLCEDATGRTVGYVIADGNGGAVPELRWRLDDAHASVDVVAALVKAAAERLFEAGAKKVKIGVPLSSRPVREALARMGFEELAPKRDAVDLSAAAKAFAAAVTEYRGVPGGGGERRRSAPSVCLSVGLADKEWLPDRDASRVLRSAFPAALPADGLVLSRPGEDDLGALLLAIPPSATFRRADGTTETQDTTPQTAYLAMLSGNVVMAALQDGSPVGSVSTGVNHDGAVEVGWYVREDMRGNGYGTAMTRAVAEALFAVGIERVTCAMDARNEASARLAAAVGFVEEDTHPAVRAFRMTEADLRRPEPQAPRP